MELRVILASGTRNSLLFARFLNSTGGQGAFPRPLLVAPGASSAPPSASAWMPYRPRPSPWLASWDASAASSCHLRGPTWRLPPLPQTLPPEAEELKFKSSDFWFQALSVWSNCSRMYSVISFQLPLQCIAQTFKDLFSFKYSIPLSTKFCLSDRLN